MDYDPPEKKPLKINTEMAVKPFAIDRSRGTEMVQYKAWREGRPHVIGYGMTPEEAEYDLKNNVQPDWDGSLDGEGPYPTPAVGGNMFPPKKKP
jgi:hypothetical protein